MKRYRVKKINIKTGKATTNYISARSREEAKTRMHETLSTNYMVISVEPIRTEEYRGCVHLV